MKRYEWGVLAWAVGSSALVVYALVTARSDGFPKDGGVVAFLVAAVWALWIFRN